MRLRATSNATLPHNQCLASLSFAAPSYHAAADGYGVDCDHGRHHDEPVHLLLA